MSGDDLTEGLALEELKERLGALEVKIDALVGITVALQSTVDTMVSTLERMFPAEDQP